MNTYQLTFSPQFSLTPQTVLALVQQSVGQAKKLGYGQLTINLPVIKQTPSLMFWAPETANNRSGRK